MWPGAEGDLWRWCCGHRCWDFRSQASKDGDILKIFEVLFHSGRMGKLLVTLDYIRSLLVMVGWIHHLAGDFNVSSCQLSSFFHLLFLHSWSRPAIQLPKIIPTLQLRLWRHFHTFPIISPSFHHTFATEETSPKTRTAAPPPPRCESHCEAYLSLPRVETDLVENIPDEDVDGGRVSQELNLLTLWGAERLGECGGHSHSHGAFKSEDQREKIWYHFYHHYDNHYHHITL